MIRAVLFDIDDTLVDHKVAMRAATEALSAAVAGGRVFDEFDVAWRAAHARHYPRFLRGEIPYGETSRARVRETIDPLATDEACDAIFHRYLADYERHWTLFADVLPCLDAMGPLPLGVISNGRAGEQKRKLIALGISDRFKYVCVSEDCGVAKPEPRIFHHTCEVLAIPSHQALYVGDQYEIDACAANAAGLQSVWLNRGAEGRPEDGPIVSIDTLAALHQLVRG